MIRRRQTSPTTGNESSVPTTRPGIAPTAPSGSRGAPRPASRAVLVGLTLLLTASLGACSLINQVNQPSTVFDWAPGTCFNAGVLATSSTDVPTIDCRQPHDAEIIDKAASSVTGGYDAAAIRAAAQRHCDQALVQYVGVNWIDLKLVALFLYPDQEAWNNNRRDVLCYAHTADGQPTLTTSVKGKGA